MIRCVDPVCPCCFRYLAVLFVMSPLQADVISRKLKRALPEFQLQSVADETWQSGSLQGKPWVINFWATWCPPCIEEIPSMNAAWDVLEEKGFGMLAINAGEGRAAVEIFLDSIPIDFPVLLGDNHSLPNWSVRALPTTIVVDAEGNVIYEALGPREWDDSGLLERLTKLADDG